MGTTLLAGARDRCAGTGCTGGAKVVNATACTWTAVASTGKQCVNMGTALTCNNGNFSATPTCLGPNTSDLLNDAVRLDSEVEKLENTVRTTEGSVQDLNVLVGSLADNLTKAAQMASASGAMARANAAAG